MSPIWEDVTEETLSALIGPDVDLLVCTMGGLNNALTIFSCGNAPTPSLFLRPGCGPILRPAIWPKPSRNSARGIADSAPSRLVPPDSRHSRPRIAQVHSPRSS